VEGSTARQLQPQPEGFPQRKKKKDDVHQLQPSSVDKFIAGVWKQIYSSVEVGPTTVVSLSAALLGPSTDYCEKDNLGTTSLASSGADLEVGTGIFEEASH
jgi:hypothetical protein